MSTRATVHFQEGGETLAIVYRHYDGQPDNSGLAYDLGRFFKEVQRHTDDTRFNDASYLAAKFVVWQATEYKGNGALDFLGIGVVLEDPEDIAFRYLVACDSSDTPSVVVQKV